MDYVIGVANPGPGGCRLRGIQGFDEEYLLQRGVPLAASFPAQVSFSMDRDYPRDLRTEDFLDNTEHALVVSDRVRETLGAGLKNNEYLPVTILNHKGRKERGPFFILHQVALQDCLDLKVTKFRRSSLNPDLFGMAENLALKANAVEAGVDLFRMKYLPFVPVFSRELADRILAAGLAGLEFVDPAAYSY